MLINTLEAFGKKVVKEARYNLTKKKKTHLRSFIIPLSIIYQIRTEASYYRLK